MEEIFDANGRLIAVVQHTSDGKEIHSADGVCLGRYLASCNETYDARGSLIGRGDQLMRLIR